MKKSTMKMIGRIASVILSAVLIVTGAVMFLPQEVIRTEAATLSYDVSNGNVVIDDMNSTDTYVITGTSSSNNVTLTVPDGVTAHVKFDGLNIDVSAIYQMPAVLVSGSGNVVIILEGSNMLKSGENCAGLQKDSTGTLTISGTGSLDARGGYYFGAGIGGGYASVGSNIVISGGTISANGGMHGAGIGGGSLASGSDISITDGTVKAIGGCFGAGIGGGDAGNGENISISGGTVYAIGGESGSGIGGGLVCLDEFYYRGDASGIVISGSANVYVAGGASGSEGSSGAAIGTGGWLSGGSYYREPDTTGLYSTGSISCYPAGTTLGTITGGTAQPESTTAGSLHAITVNTSGNGSASASATHAASGTDITLTVNPGNGYIFKEWQVSPDTVTITNNSFTMPDEAVTVTAVFETVPQNPSAPGTSTGPTTPTGSSTPTVVHESEPEPPVNYMQEVEDKITEAINLGGTRVVRIEGYPTLSYHVLEMLKNHRDITLVSEFTYDGLEYRITIPGSAVKLDPSINWYGPKYLFPMFYMYGTDTLPAVQAYLDKYES